MIHSKLHQAIIIMLILLLAGSVSGAATVDAEIVIDPAHPDTLLITAANYAEKTQSDADLMCCIGPVDKRRDSGVICITADTALFCGLPSPETFARMKEIAKAKNNILVLRDHKEGTMAARMFDLSKFDVIIYNAPAVSAGVSAADLVSDLGDEVADFDIHYGAVPNKVLLLTAPSADAKLTMADAVDGLYKTLIKFDGAAMVVAMYWLEDATFAAKAYNPNTNGKILILNDDDDWYDLMKSDKFASDISADLVSAVVMPPQAPSRMVSGVAKCGVQRIVLYGYTAEDIASASAGDPVSLVRMIDRVSVFNCLYPAIKLFCYRT
jgi:hypothetical protein